MRRRDARDGLRLQSLYDQVNRSLDRGVPSFSEATGRGEIHWILIEPVARFRAHITALLGERHGGHLRGQLRKNLRRDFVRNLVGQRVAF